MFLALSFENVTSPTIEMGFVFSKHFSFFFLLVFFKRIKSIQNFENIFKE